MCAYKEIDTYVCMCMCRTVGARRTLPAYAHGARGVPVDVWVQVLPFLVLEYGPSSALRRVQSVQEARY